MSLLCHLSVAVHAVMTCWLCSIKILGVVWLRLYSSCRLRCVNCSWTCARTLDIIYVNHCIYADINVYLYDTYMRYMKLKHFTYVVMYDTCMVTYMLPCMLLVWNIYFHIYEMFQFRIFHIYSLICVPCMLTYMLLVWWHVSYLYDTYMLSCMLLVWRHVCDIHVSMYVTCMKHIFSHIWNVSIPYISHI